MASKRRSFHTSNLLKAVIVLVGWGTSHGQDPSARKDVGWLVDRLPAIADAWDWDDPWFGEIRLVDKVEMATALSDAIQHRQEFQTAPRARLAYLSLVLIHAEETDIGRTQLLAGLRSEYTLVRGICVEAIAPVARVHADEVVPHLVDLWSNVVESLKAPTGNGASPLSAKGNVALVRTSSKLGAEGKPLVPFLERAFRDGDNTVRTEAAAAIMSILGVRTALSRLAVAGTEHEGHIVMALGVNAARSGSTRLSSDDADAARERCLSATTSTDPAVRKVAIRNLEVVFHGAFVVAQPSGEFEMDPVLKDRLEYLAREDADEEIRRLADGLLAPEALARNLRAEEKKE